MSSLPAFNSTLEDWSSKTRVFQYLLINIFKNRCYMYFPVADLTSSSIWLRQTLWNLEKQEQKPFVFPLYQRSIFSLTCFTAWGFKGMMSPWLREGCRHSSRSSLDYRSIWIWATKINSALLSKQVFTLSRRDTQKADLLALRLVSIIYVDLYSTTTMHFAFLSFSFTADMGWPP